MGAYHFRQWDETPATTNDYSLVTKLQNFENVYSKKSILGFILNITDASENDSYLFNLSYRTGENGSWLPLGVVNKRSNEGVGTSSFKRIFGTPIRGVVNFQLSIKGRVKGPVAINDISIIYRKWRDTSEQEL
tara:strand:- start:178 stop:576 length:399 start_codon:yes stop_codon:yes gene_type:complete